jgi:inhibitor of cysteine peptidase
LFEHFPPVESEEVNVDEQDNGSQIDLKQGQILVITLQSNPTTGYRWEQVENQDSTLEQMGEAEFKPSETGGPPPVGDGGWEIFHYKAVSAEQKTLTLVYHRPWEEGVEPLRTFSLQIVVR